MTTGISRARRLLTLAALLGVSAAFGSGPADRNTPLDRYVATPDSHYKYDLVATVPSKGYTAYIIDLTSQQWRSASEVNRPIWKHWLTIVRPDEVRSDTALLFITGGSVDQKAPAAAPPEFIEAATATHSVVAELRGIPNEPLVFSDDKKVRTEDQIIAYTWVKFLKTGDDTWPLRMPMTKASVRAMDTVTAFCATPAGGNVKVARYIVSGASKRGWTTWTTAAVDSRVVAFVPMVIDVLNNVKSIEHQYQAYGFYAPAVKDYQDMGLMTVSHTSEYQALMKLEDPYSYRDRYTMPKLIINSAGDQYFMPDSSQFYFDALPGEKYLRYVPNTKHNLNSDARESMLAFYDAVLRGQPRPRFSWKFEKNGSIRVTTADRPTEVKLWAATNPEKRDFRLDTLGPAYKSTILSASGKTYVGRVEKPAKGWTAYFIELTYPSGGKYPFKFTTAVRITPDTLPFPAPKSEGKISNLP
jgi:PhoPQ-activated pathogenicity-related protein